MRFLIGRLALAGWVGLALTWSLPASASGKTLRETFREQCDEPTYNLQPPLAGNCHQLAIDAARAFAEERRAGRVIEAYRALIAFDDRLRWRSANRGPMSTVAIEAHYDLASTYESITVYSAAADWYERYAALSPNASKAEKALAHAVALRLMLGEIDAATRAVRDFVRDHAKASPGRAAELLLALASHHADQMDWDAVRRLVESERGRFDGAPVDLQIRAHALLARAGVRPIDEQARVYALYRAPDLERQIRKGWPEDDDATIARRLAQTTLDLGKAFFAAVEARQRATIEVLPYPAYSGSGDPTSVMAHLETKAKPWAARRLSATLAIERDYARILDLVSAPSWRALGAARVALMWAAFVDAFDPPPPTGFTTVPLRAQYFDAIDRLREPIKAQHAKPALLRCKELAATGDGDAISQGPDSPRACAVWLAARYRAEHHTIDELVPLRIESSTRLPPLPPLRLDETPQTVTR